MKKIVFYIIAMASLVSCLNGTSYTSTYKVIASFEYDNVKFRTDSTYFSSHEELGLGWNYLGFCHNVDKDGDFRGGFRLSRLEGLIKEEENTTPLDLTWRIHSTPGANDYMVFWNSSEAPESHVIFLVPTLGTCKMVSCFVCNTAKVAEELKSEYERGDKLTLRAVGYLNKVETGRAEIALADYTQYDKNGAPKDSIVSRWTQFDLTKLGTVDAVKFEMSDLNKKNISEYFCLDNLLAEISLEY